MKKCLFAVLIGLLCIYANSADRTVVRISQTTLIVPEHVEYPVIRLPINSGVLTKGDRVIFTLIVRDKNGVIKSDSTYRVIFDEWPTDTNKEVLGVGTLNFAESPK